MTTYPLFNLLTGEDSGGTWAIGSCGAPATISWITLDVATGIITIDDDNAVAGMYSFNYSFPATDDCTASCTSVVINITVDAECPTAGVYVGTPGQINITL